MARTAAPLILPPADHATLRSILKKGTHKSRKITRARALLAMGAGKARLVVQTEAGISANQYYCLKRLTRRKSCFSKKQFFYDGLIVLFIFHFFF